MVGDPFGRERSCQAEASLTRTGDERREVTVEFIDMSGTGHPRSAGPQPSPPSSSRLPNQTAGLSPEMEPTPRRLPLTEIASVFVVPVTGLGGVAEGALTALLNVTAVNARGPGFMTVFPCGTDLPNASNLNFANGDTLPNAVVAQVSLQGTVCVYPSQTTDLVVDINGDAT